MPARVQSDTIGMLLTDVSRLLRSAFDSRINAADLGITAGEARTLIQVASVAGIKQTDIAARMGIEPMTLSACLDRLEALGLVARLPDPADRRAKNVVVTGKADPLLAAIMREVDAVMSRVTADFDDGARQALQGSLLLLRDNLHDMLGCTLASRRNAAE
ncbi:MarR family winged helix-turn-helix transcriptional regulator [Pararhizobium sp.]|uniref:MarR family winged helix-turn-helix transcriptional regulator n=1 Tax=Pararhizobium sp. TaxID=1977563 RepID=UPI002725DE0B|nr:MarR family transcriptional regulator [Pararhizobium sp.]MDO9416550.1 MarR family transcriptional regulator [Pararhizobium sp.]